MEEIRSIERETVAACLPPRRKEAHKGEFGRVLGLCGSPGMGGAAILSARAALRGGAGLMRVCTDEALFPALHSAVPEATCLPHHQLQKGLAEATAVYAGPGLGSGMESRDRIRRLLLDWQGPLLLDADALNCLAEDSALARLAAEKAAGGNGGPRLLLTPHPGEAGRLLGCSAREINAARSGAAKALAERYGAVAVLKGAGTLVADPDGHLLQNGTGNPGMATAGSGDVLSGLIAALLARGIAPFAAACCGVYLHGLAGDLAAARLGEESLVASDIIEALPEAFRSLRGSAETERN